MFQLPKMRALAALLLSLLPLTSLAADIMVSDPYVRVSRPNAPTGAAFMAITNTGVKTDRLLSASSDAAKRVELHRHVDNGDGVMRMTQIEEGIELAPGQLHVLARGGDHVMLMGLVSPLAQGGRITIMLEFEKAGQVIVSVPVDNER